MSVSKFGQKGFGVIETMLVLIVVILVGVIGYMIYTNHHTTQPPSTSTASTTPTVHTAQEASNFVQTTYDTYLAAINNAGTDNTQPLGLVGLAAVSSNLTSDFNAQAAASHNGSLFSCAAEFKPDKYVAGQTSSNSTSASVPVTIWNSADGSVATNGMSVSVDLVSLKITAVSCPN